MKTVLVTGPIGSGKSAACRYLASKGYPVYDCDSRCKALYDSVPGLKSRIESALGVPFSELAVIFDDAARRETLESIVYPILLEDLLEWRGSQTSETVFVESAVALSKPLFAGLFDEVLLVTAPCSLRFLRHPGAEKRDRLQSFDTIIPTYTIVNDSSLESLHSQIDSYENKSCTNSCSVR